MADSATEKYDITKLDGDNYSAWKFKVRMLLIQKGVWEVVEGTVTDEAKSAKALALIGLSVQDSQIVHIQGCTSGKDAWEKLSTLYENAGVANRLHLLN